MFLNFLHDCITRMWSLGSCRPLITLRTILSGNMSRVLRLADVVAILGPTQSNSQRRIGKRSQGVRCEGQLKSPQIDTKEIQLMYSAGKLALARWCCALLFQNQVGLTSGPAWARPLNIVGPGYSFKTPWQHPYWLGPFVASAHRVRDDATSLIDKQAFSVLGVSRRALAQRD